MLVSFENEIAANQILQRSPMLRHNREFKFIYLKKDLPREQRPGYGGRLSNMVSEAAASSSERAGPAQVQGNNNEFQFSDISSDTSEYESPVSEDSESESSTESDNNGAIRVTQDIAVMDDVDDAELPGVAEGGWYFDAADTVGGEEEDMSGRGMRGYQI